MVREPKDILLSFKGLDFSDHIKAAVYVDLGLLVGKSKNIKQLASPPYYFASINVHFNGGHLEQLLRDRHPALKEYFGGLLLKECDDLDKDFKEIDDEYGKKDDDFKEDGAHVVANMIVPIGYRKDVNMEDLLVGIRDIEE